MRIKTVIIALTFIPGMGAHAQGEQKNDAEFNGYFTMEPTKAVKSTEQAFSINFSPGWITSKVSTPQEECSWQLGMGYEVKYRCLFRRGYGFGLSYAHNSTSYSGGYDLGQNFILGSFVYGGQIGKQWYATVETGLGYANYTDGGEKVNDGLGSKYGLGIEYQLGSIFGIGLDVAYHTAIFSKDDNFNYYYNDSNRANGFHRLSINIGLRLYL